ncbi:MAG: prenyltransferase [Woeseiaceae bacterium]
MSQLSRVQPWIQAARPAAYPMIFLPLLIGQVFALQTTSSLSTSYFWYAALFGALFQILLLYLNDYSDEAVDQLATHYWLSGGSRVLPEGKLRRSNLLTGAKLVILAMLGLALWLAVLHDRPWMFAGTAAAFFCCWAYNLPPLQFSYRGHGEVLQGLGCGVMLPLIGFYLQLGSLQAFPWLNLIPLYLLFHAGNIITALPDHAADLQSDKQTYPVRHGEFRARVVALLLLAVACLAIATTGRQLPVTSIALILLPSGIILIGIVLTGTLKRADSQAFASCKQFVTWAMICQAWLLCAWIGVLLVEALR